MVEEAVILSTAKDLVGMPRLAKWSRRFFAPLRMTYYPALHLLEALCVCFVRVATLHHPLGMRAIETADMRQKQYSH